MTDASVLSSAFAFSLLPSLRSVSSASDLYSSLTLGPSDTSESSPSSRSRFRHFGVFSCAGSAASPIALWCRVWTPTIAIRATAHQRCSHRKRAARGDTNTRFEHIVTYT